MIGATYADVEPKDATQVRKLVQQILRWQCFKALKFEMTSPLNPDKTYNFLNNVGTQGLANDIDEMRGAIGSDKMNIYGVS